MGEARDSLVDRAEDVARDAMQQVRQKADRVADQAGKDPREPEPKAPRRGC